MSGDSLSHGMNNIPGQLGYLVLNDDGAVVTSQGDLINDEKTAKVFMQMVQIAWKINLGDKRTNVKRLSLIFTDHIFLATVSNGKIYIVKKAYSPSKVLA